MPTIFKQLPGSKQPTNRLEFARWLVSEENPLAARTAVNRAWQAFFGRGIVRSAGDFGTQGDRPTHPALLDWLATEFIKQGWSRKQLHRTIVLSATYRQSSVVTPDRLKRDSDGSLLSRFPRKRMDAEMIRDAFLQSGGLLSEKMFGPSVYPPQPASVTGLAYGATKWTPSRGEDRYRRSLYTFSKRTAPFAAYTVFDGPTGENCIAARNRSNTPLQALTLLNDEMFLEVARSAAKQAATKKQPDAATATEIFRRFLIRSPSKEELALVLEFQATQLARLKKGELQAEAIVGDKSASHDLAAWTLVARVVMNLDEAITKQ